MPRVTLVWQEPVTAVIAHVKHSEIDKQYLSFRDRAAVADRPPGPARAASHAQRDRVPGPARAAPGPAPATPSGGSLIPKIGASYDVIQGTDTSSLEKGPGHYPGTALPGLGQTVAIAGHRTTYLAPFRHIDELKPGDRIVLKMPYGQFTYVVQYHRIVLPTALWVTNNVGYERLVLSACNPLYSAAQRIIVFARLRRCSRAQRRRARGGVGLLADHKSLGSRPDAGWPNGMPMLGSETSMD